MCLSGSSPSPHTLRLSASFPLQAMSCARQSSSEAGWNLPAGRQEGNFPELDLNFCRERLQQHTTTDPALALVGLYVVTTDVQQPSQMHARLLEQVCEPSLRHDWPQHSHLLAFGSRALFASLRQALVFSLQIEVAPVSRQCNSLEAAVLRLRHWLYALSGQPAYSWCFLNE